MDWKSISFEDKTIIEEMIQLKPYPLSDYNFTHMNIWQNAFKLSFTITNGNLIVRGKDPISNEDYIYMPMGIGNLQTSIDSIRSEFKRWHKPLIIKALTPKMMSEIRTLNIPCSNFTFNRNEYEYIYKTKHIAEYSDKNLRRKRELCRHFESNYIYEFIRYETEHHQLVLDLIEKWHENREDDGFIVKSEKEGILKILNRFDQLTCEGFLLIISGEVVGFIIAESLTADILLIHYEKGLRAYKGVYDILKRNVSRYYQSEFKYISLEEDMGIKGLRIAKELYRPNHLISKGTITFMD
ncbi:DUF2156 domain-containing protein [Fusibacter ferrireducens]|uniref:DUF2156 domain-containing protein n=1 Tax=Fusibacter ferrireducens TaxID=2785058 RepID=A0ABR9ZNK1_9FIRM|nr:phosphatidylglycerol lysyltransferase domain-containing protein [Fusibacter ferrireducens]MBF4692050.1 DUF2156 domain-containing protein [Fusibacter ferrireducens]